MRNKILAALVIICFSAPHVKSQSDITCYSPSQSPIILLSYYGLSHDTIACYQPDKDGVVNVPQELAEGFYTISQNSLSRDFIFTPKEKLSIYFNDSTIDLSYSLENNLLDTVRHKYLSYKTRKDNLLLIKRNAHDNEIHATRIDSIIGKLQHDFNHELNELRLKYPSSYAIISTCTYIEKLTSNSKSSYFENLVIDKKYLNSTLYPNLFMNYFKEHTAYDESGFKSSIDTILHYTSSDQSVYNYALKFILELFDKVGPKIIYDYIIDNYLLNGGCNEGTELVDKAILEGYLSLRIGNKPDNIDILGKDLYSICSAKDHNIIVFWSSHCSFCKEALPELLRLQSKTDNINIIAFSLDTDLSNNYYLNVLNNYPWTHVCDKKSWDSPYVDHFKINKTPSIYYLDSSSTILGKNLSTIELEKLIKARQNSTDQ